jgi:hypothetical protein
LACHSHLLLKRLTLRKQFLEARLAYFHSGRFAL